MPQPAKASDALRSQDLECLIVTVRSQRVMLDVSLASLYRVTTANLNLAVRRNCSRFPHDFMFPLIKPEVDELRSHFAEPGQARSWGGRRRSFPNAFTEQGVAMLSSVLRSERAVEMNIRIMRIFARLRQSEVQEPTLGIEVRQLQQDVLQMKRDFHTLIAEVQGKVKPRRMGFAAGAR